MPKKNCQTAPNNSFYYIICHRGKLSESTQPITKPIESLYHNFLVAQSTIYDFQSYQYKEFGCPYIRTFCKVLREKWNSVNILQLFNEIANEQWTDPVPNVDKTDGGNNKNISVFKISPEIRVFGIMSDFQNYPLNVACLRPKERQEIIESE